MSDDFGTINVRRGERKREIDVLRQHYLHHRHALSGLVADAPTEHLASEYQRLIVDLDESLRKLDELEGHGAAVPPVRPSPIEQPRPHGDPLRTVAADAGSRPLINAPSGEYDEEYGTRETDLPMGTEEPRSRVALILVAALVALGLIGWMIWRGSSNDREERPIIEEATTPVESTVETVATEPPVPRSTVAVTPASHDYGTIRKGTRATRQFEIANNGEEPVTVQVARSACRCLYYEYTALIPPKAKESLTVTIDGARATAGELRETIRVTTKADSKPLATFDVIATVR